MAQILSCPCGRKLVARASGAAGPLVCPGCGKPLVAAQVAAPPQVPHVPESVPVARARVTPAASAAPAAEPNRTRQLLVWLPLIWLLGPLVVPLYFLVQSLNSKASAAVRSRNRRRLAVTLGLFVVAGLVGYVYLLPHVNHFLNTVDPSRVVLRIPPGSYPLQTYHETKEDIEAVCAQGNVPAFALNDEQGLPPGVSLLTEFAGPISVKRYEDGHEVARRSLNDALDSWVSITSSWQLHCITLRHVKQEQDVEYVLEVGEDEPALLGASTDRLQSAFRTLQKSQSLREAIATADRYEGKLLSIFGPTSGVLREYRKFRQERLEASWLSGGWTADKVESRVKAFAETITHRDPGESLCLISVVHGDALTPKQIEQARESLGYKMASSYAELDQGAGLFPGFRFRNALAMLDGVPRRPETVTDADEGLHAVAWQGEVDPEVPVMFVAAIDPDFEMTVRQLQWTYQELTGPKLVRTWSVGRITYWLWEWSSRGRLWLEAVLANYRRGDPAVNPVRRLVDAIGQAVRLFGVEGGGQDGSPKVAPPRPDAGGSAPATGATHAGAAVKGYPGIRMTPNELGPDFAGTTYLKTDLAPDQKNIVKIQLQGSRYQDFKEANRLAGFEGAKPPKGYTWHHLPDYDPVTGEATMQLVEEAAHRATFPHKGAVYQYEQATGKTYK